MVRMEEEEWRTVHIPAILIALLLVLGLGSATVMFTNWADMWLLPFLLLPLWTAIGGFVATRWALHPPQVPGLTVGLISIAVQIGLGLGIGNIILRIVEPRLIMLELLAALSGGLVGSLLSSQGEQIVTQPEPE